MGRFDGILITTDLDGTLLSNDKTVSRENLDAIEYFKSEGGFFTFITGRMPSYVGDIVDTVKPNAPFGCINGGGLYDHEKKKYLLTTPLDPEALILARHITESIPEIGVQLSGFDKVYFARDNAAMEHFRAVTGIPNLTCTLDGIGCEMAKILFGDLREDNIDLCARLLSEHPLAPRFDFIRSELTLYEILPKGVNKGAVLKPLSKLLGTDIGHTVAVGDYENDIGMVKAAGVGIAVSNARPALKAIADHITVSNEESAIARIVEDIEGGKIKFR